MGSIWGSPHLGKQRATFQFVAQGCLDGRRPQGDNLGQAISIVFVYGIRCILILGGSCIIVLQGRLALGMFRAFSGIGAEEVRR